MKRILMFLTLMSIVLVYNVTKNEQDSIVIYSSMEQYRGEELQRQLNEKFPNDHIMVMYVPTAKSASKVFVEGEKTDADIIVGLETSYLDKISESLVTLRDAYKVPYLDGLTIEDNENKFMTWEKQSGSFIVNTHVLSKYNLPTPTSYEELLNPMYEGLIAMPDPKSSGTGYFFYKNLVNTRGLDAALDYIDELANNVKSFTESGSGPVKMLIQEEIAIGLGLTFQGVGEINEGSPFQIIYPQEGSPYSLTGTALVKGRENDAKINEIFGFIVNDFLVYDKEYFSPEMIYEGQINRIENYPTGIVYADMTGISDMKEKEKLLDLWKY